MSYHIGFASVFLLVAATSLIQLFICIHAEYARLKTPSFLKACRITNQKFLYILVFLAALLRGLYFAYPVMSLQLLNDVLQLMVFFLIDTGFNGSMVIQSSKRLLSGSVDRRFADRVFLGGGKKVEWFQNQQSLRVPSSELSGYFFIASFGKILKGKQRFRVQTQTTWQSTIQISIVIWAVDIFYVARLHQVFHLRDVQERPPFLSKSFLGFLAFNIITYSLLIAELVITNTQIHSEEDKVRKSRCPVA